VEERIEVRVNNPFTPSLILPHRGGDDYIRRERTKVRMNEIGIAKVFNV
jgi:hypothetical protein